MSTGRVVEGADANTGKGGTNEREDVFTGSSLAWSITTEACRDTLGAVRARDFGTGLKTGPPFSAKKDEERFIRNIETALTDTASHIGRVSIWKKSLRWINDDYFRKVYTF